MAAPIDATAAHERIVLGMGCFWGAEKRLAALPGVVATSVGYAGGERENPSYYQVLADERRPTVRNHAEVVQVTFDPGQISLAQILATFWENHDPTQGNRQGNDIGTNYRSAIYFTAPAQQKVAEMTRATYQTALTAAGFGKITTEIAALTQFYPAEPEHQQYLVRNPSGYCGLGGIGVKFPTAVKSTPPSTASSAAAVQVTDLSRAQQLIVFASIQCSYCAQFDRDIAANWAGTVPIITTTSTQLPDGWTLAQPLWATPTVVLFRDATEVARFTGYQGQPAAFWRWLGEQLLTPEEQHIAYQHGTERPFTGNLLDQHTPGTYIDPLTGAALFRSDSKFNSGSGWPSFFQPINGAVTLHEDESHGMKRTEVRSASSGIHLGHVFNDGPAPTGQRYCINSHVLRFIPDQLTPAAE
ncbi:peptide-methionine (S)-S-oxide reductase MsrA [Rhodopseudomonas palustris]|uniref:Peptide methionine sulfoxide reductase MsrA n=2 Tax=Thiospirillum jenense TaxID=1653858 RepID=A0A839H2U7_9GAMM|nr:peptide-methionine (S)-S-oxide reductase MsrA [Rhodopseudomonas palustris]MBB1124775.1 peptide-methionine (S)-S-oxide reductase MsrA [Thiospirillum jenense]